MRLLQGNIGLGYSATGAPDDPILDLSSADLTTGTNGGTLTIELSETGFTSTAAATFPEQRRRGLCRQRRRDGYVLRHVK